MSISIPISNDELQLVIEVCKEEVERCQVERQLFKLAVDDHEKSLRRQKEAIKLLNRLVVCAIKTGNEFKSVATRPELN